MASNDLEVIKEIEKALQLQLHHAEKIVFHPEQFIEIVSHHRYINRSYTVNEQGHITALRIRFIGLGYSHIDSFSLFKSSTNSKFWI
ncbi:MAG: hypothetical protein D3908_05450 [Candidatus Electrothrix sp. AUS4]|nr:hypothetical protein [Candidatus Electrothrix sp. AUS4]